MKRKQSIYLLLSLALLTSCGTSTTSSNNNYSSSTGIDGSYYQKVTERVSFDENNTNNIHEDFKDGIDGDVFSSVDGVWDAGSTQPHNGVRSRNLFYTIDDNGNKILAIKGRGRYNQEDESTKGKPEGAVLITNNHLSPGRYEIEMAAFPRFGGCSAFWTYCTTTGSEATSQNEIDIELGGEGQFTNEWCTTWTTHTNKETKNIDLSEQLHFNDGKFHKYTFDWYTDYENSGEKRVDWFVDEVFVTSISGSAVSEHEMQLWLGLWLPSWAGSSFFDTDYMLIKSIKFTAFDASQFYETCRSKTSFTTTNPNDLNIQTIDYSTIKNINKLTNGDFSLSSTYSENNYYGWNIEDASSGTMEFLNEGSISSSKALKLTAGKVVEGRNYHGQYVYQELGGAYDAYKYKLKIDAKKETEDSSGNIEIKCLDTSKTLTTQSIAIDSTSYKTYEEEIIMPKNSNTLRITITSENGSVSYSNASLTYLGND